MKIRIRKEIKAALLFITALALFIWGLNYMKGRNMFSHEIIIYAKYEKIAGLATNNPVQINGFQVGLVRNISFIPGDPKGGILVEIGISEDIQIPIDSKAIIEPGLISSNVVSIRLGESKKYINPYDTLGSGIATSIQEQVSLEMLPIKKKAENLMMSIDTVLNVIQYIFNEETRDNLSRSFASIRSSIDYLKHTTYNIDILITSQKNRLARIVGNITAITENLEENNEAITNIISNFSNISDSIAKTNFSQTLVKADKAIGDFALIVEEIKSGDGTLTRLINDDTLYSSLSNTADELNQLIEDIKLSPQRYLHFSVFGKNPKKNIYEPNNKEE